MIGDINSFAIGDAPEINGSIVIDNGVTIVFIGIDDEAVFPLFIGRKLGGIDVLCPGDNVNRMCTPTHAEPPKPKCR